MILHTLQTRHQNLEAPIVELYVAQLSEPAQMSYQVGSSALRTKQLCETESYSADFAQLLLQVFYELSQDLLKSHLILDEFIETVSETVVVSCRVRQRDPFAVSDVSEETFLRLRQTLLALSKVPETLDAKTGELLSCRAVLKSCLTAGISLAAALEILENPSCRMAFSNGVLAPAQIDVFKKWQEIPKSFADVKTSMV